jgi:uncharacterized protein YrrD
LGTKWDACSCSLQDNILQFETAWSNPLPVLEALSKSNPKVTIKVTYADEYIGHNCGIYYLLDGKVIKEETLELVDAIYFGAESFRIFN